MIAAALIVGFAASASTSADVQCPQELEATAVTVTSPPQGWTGFVQSKLVLHNVGISTGELKDRAALIGDYRKGARGAYSVTFSELRGWGAYSRWLTCQYGDSNDIVIGKRLPSNIDTCVATYTIGQFRETIIKIDCK